MSPILTIAPHVVIAIVATPIAVFSIVAVGFAVCGVMQWVVR